MREMSFLESGKEAARWIAAPLRHSVSKTPGCLHCGTRLEMNAVGMYPLSGKCDNCLNRVFDEDEGFEELEY
jgi:hypothetical protein